MFYGLHDNNTIIDFRRFEKAGGFLFSTDILDVSLVFTGLLNFLLTGDKVLFRICLMFFIRGNRKIYEKSSDVKSGVFAFL